MIVQAEQNHDWTMIREKGKKTIEAGGKVIIGVTDFVKTDDFENWLSMAEGQGK